MRNTFLKIIKHMILLILLLTSLLICFLYALLGSTPYFSNIYSGGFFFILIPIIIIFLEFYFQSKKRLIKKVYFCLGLLILYFTLFSLVISIDFPLNIPEVKGQVINSVTGEHISGIQVVRQIPVKINQIVDGDVNIRDSYYKKTFTDSNGMFVFPSEKYKIKGRPFNYPGEEDIILVNVVERESAYPGLIHIRTNFKKINKEEAKDKVFYTRGFDVNKVILSDSIEKIEETYIIQISPKVNSIDACKNEFICEQDNWESIAIENLDEDLCLHIQEFYHDEYYYEDKIKNCILQIAKEKNDSSICDLLIGINSNLHRSCTSEFIIY